MNDQAEQPMDDEKFPTRLSYLLRIWQTGEPDLFNWRFSLENPETGKRIGFASLEELFLYLMDLCECHADTAGKKP